MHFACSPSVAQASSPVQDGSAVAKLWGKQASSPAKDITGPLQRVCPVADKMRACRTAKMAVLRHLQRCADFGRHSLRLSCRTKIYRHTFTVPKWPEKSLMNAVRICFPEIGGTKNRGAAPSGICNCKTPNWFGVTNRRELGS